jgi:ribosomal protein L37AE/L43A
MLQCGQREIARFRRFAATNNGKFSRKAAAALRTWFALFAVTKTSCGRHAVAKDRSQVMNANGVRDVSRRRGKTAEEASMNARAEAHVTSHAIAVASRRLALPACPECDDLQFAPAASEFVGKGQVRHFWSCEACGHEFSTSVKVPFVPGTRAA